MPPKRLTRIEQKARTRERLLRAAAKVFARRGFHGASVEEIAREAGYTIGALYSNFGSKEDLYLALLDEHVAERIAEYRAVFQSARDDAERARGGADDWMVYLRRNREFFLLAIEFWTYAVRERRLRPRIAKAYQAFRQTFAVLIEEGAAAAGIELPEGFAERMGIVINALGQGIALEKLADPDGVPDELFGDALEMIFGALAASVPGVREAA